jgi:hypothetical protein
VVGIFHGTSGDNREYQEIMLGGYHWSSPMTILAYFRMGVWEKTSSKQRVTLGKQVSISG